MPLGKNKTKKIDISKKPVRLLLQDIDEGKFAVPKLQREFVWDGPRSAKLIDSICKGLPIGVVLIWKTPKNKILYLRQHYHVLPPFNTKNSQVWFLIDGQQRISVLHHIKEGGNLHNARGKIIDFSKVVLALEKQKDGQQIRYRNASPGRFLSVNRILHPQWRHKVGNLNKKQISIVKEYRERILRYKMHLMVIQMKINDVKECFLRINTQGMKVSTADAIFTKAEVLDLRDFVHEVRKNLENNFKIIPDLPVLWAFTSTRHVTEARGQAIEKIIKSIEKKASNDKRQRKKLAKDWVRLASCFGKAVDYLRSNFQVISREYLYSDYIIAMLALFYFWNQKGPNIAQKSEIRKWFWSTEVGSRYSGHNFHRCIPEDVHFFKKLANNPKVKFHFKELVDLSDIRKTKYAGHSGISSAFYSLLLMNKPVSIMDDGLNEIPLERYSAQSNRKDRHHIYPRSILSGLGVSANRYNSICNICLLTAEENKQIGSRRPHSYLGQINAKPALFAKKMKRHLIPTKTESGIWNKDIKRGFNAFIKMREDYICGEMEKEAGRKLFRRN